MSPANQLLLTVALVIGIAVGIMYIGSTVSAQCFSFWPFSGKACVVTSK